MDRVKYPTIKPSRWDSTRRRIIASKRTLKSTNMRDALQWCLEPSGEPSNWTTETHEQYRGYIWAPLIGGTRKQLPATSVHEEREGKWTTVGDSPMTNMTTALLRRRDSNAAAHTISKSRVAQEFQEQPSSYCQTVMSDNGWDECCSFRPPGHHVEYHPPEVTTEFCRMAERDTMKSVQGCQEQFGSSDTFLVLTAKAQSEARETANRPGTRSATERGQVGLSSGIRTDRGPDSIIAKSMVARGNKRPYLRSRSSGGRKTNDVLVQRVGGGYQLYTAAQWSGFRLKESSTMTPPDLARHKGTQTGRSLEVFASNMGQNRTTFSPAISPLPSAAVQQILEDIDYVVPPCKYAREQLHTQPDTSHFRVSPFPASPTGTRRSVKPLRCSFHNRCSHTCSRGNTCSNTDTPLLRSFCMAKEKVEIPAHLILTSPRTERAQSDIAHEQRSTAFGRPHSASCHARCVGANTVYSPDSSHRGRRALRSSSGATVIWCKTGEPATQSAVQTAAAAYPRRGSGHHRSSSMWNTIQSQPDLYAIEDGTAVPHTAVISTRKDSCFAETPHCCRYPISKSAQQIPSKPGRWKPALPCATSPRHLHLSVY